MKIFTLKMEKIVWLMLIVSIILYLLDLKLFGRRDEIAFSFLGNLAFLPIYVLFVTLMIERVLKERGRVAIRQKLNMVIGVFFSEVGSSLLRDCLTFVGDAQELPAHLKVTPKWTSPDFAQAKSFLKNLQNHVDSRLGDLAVLKGVPH